MQVKLNNLISDNPLNVVAVVIIIVCMVMAIFAPWIATHDPTSTEAMKEVEGEILFPPFAPGLDNLFGTDQIGRDIFSRVVYGMRISLFVGVAARGLSMLLGIVLGVTAGLIGGKLDNFIMRITDVFLALPAILLAMIITLILSPSLMSVIIAIMLVGWPDVARLIRGEVLSICKNEYIEASKALGANKRRIVLNHIIPNCFGIIITTFSMGIPGAVMYEAGLSFFGLGVQPPAPSIGNIIAHGRGYIMIAPWYSFFPGLVLALFVIAVNIFGDTIIDVFDPTYKKHI